MSVSGWGVVVGGRAKFARVSRLEVVQNLHTNILIPILFILKRIYRLFPSKSKRAFKNEIYSFDNQELKRSCKICTSEQVLGRANFAH